MSERCIQPGLPEVVRPPMSPACRETALRSEWRFAARHRAGTVLIVAMVILFSMVSMVIVLGQAMRVEVRASANEHSAAEARAIARGAEQYVLALLTESTDPVETLPETDFEAVPVGTGYFWIVRPDYNDPTLPQFGLVDESSKLDLNLAPRDVLLRLPGMTDELASSIIDWRDADDNVTNLGAESETYLQREDGYRAKNQPFELVEELLLVNGMDRELLYGPRGGGESDLIAGTFAAELYQSQGLFNFFTVWGKPARVASDGTQRLNPNSQQTRQEFRDMLREQLGEARGNEVGDLLGQGNMRNLLDFAIRTGLKVDELQILEPYVLVEPTTQADPGAPPPLRVNINAAPREVLMTLEGLSEADADTLLARRPPLGGAVGSTDPGSIAWVLDAFGDPQRVSQKLIDMGDQITGRGGCWSADIVAVSGNGRSFCRVRIVVDATEATPRIVYRRDITEQGWPLDDSIRQALRSGNGI